MLNLGQPSYIRYGISHPVLSAVVALRFTFASVDSALLCTLAAESWRRNCLPSWERLTSKNNRTVDSRSAQLGKSLSTIRSGMRRVCGDANLNTTALNVFRVVGL
jgi:hypothetical protein